MAKICKNCGQRNENDRLFCSVCGGPLDNELKLIMDLEEKKKGAAPEPPPEKTKAAPKPAQPQRAQGDDYIPPVRKAPEKKSKVWPWVIIALVVIGGAVYLLMR